MADKMNEIFGRQGIPAELMLDNMPFDSREFRRFAMSWGNQRVHIQPGVHSVKRQSREVCPDHQAHAQEDRRLPPRTPLSTAIRLSRGTPYSPAQTLMSRALRSKLSIAKHRLQPEVVDSRPQLHLQVWDKRSITIEWSRHSRISS